MDSRHKHGALKYIQVKHLFRSRNLLTNNKKTNLSQTGIVYGAHAPGLVGKDHGPDAGTEA